MFLDFDDTLFDFGHAFRTALAEALAPVCARAAGDPARVAERCRAAWQAVWDRFAAGEVDEEGLWRERTAAVLRAAALAHDEALAATVRARYLAAMAAAARLFPDAAGAVAALATLRPPLTLAILTNGPDRGQRERIRALGLHDRFPVVVTSGDVGVHKPAPAFYATALRRAGVDAAEAVMIGDDPVADVAGAAAAGLRAIWLNRTGRPWPADVRPGPNAAAADLGQAVAWVRLWHAGR